jgi:transposase-like protein
MDKSRRCNYKRITEEVRMEIIDRILEKGENIKDVAQ